MENFTELGGGLIIVTGFIVIVYIIARYTYFIKKLMIERGLTGSSNSGRFKYIDAACIVLGLGIGILVSAIYTTFPLTEDTMDLLIWGTILVFGALGLLIAHYLRRRVEK